MVTIESTIQNGVVTLPPEVRLRNGSRVLITILESRSKKENRMISDEIEKEDVAFVSACRGRLAMYISDDESHA